MGKRGPKPGTKYQKNPYPTIASRKVVREFGPFLVCCPVQVAKVQRFSDMLTAVIMELEARDYPVSELNEEMCMLVMHGLVLLENACIESIYRYDAPDPPPDPPFPPGWRIR